MTRPATLGWMVFAVLVALGCGGGGGGEISHPSNVPADSVVVSGGTTNPDVPAGGETNSGAGESADTPAGGSPSTAAGGSSPGAAGGVVYQWGNLVDELGSAQTPTPQLVPGLWGITAIAAGNHHSLALLKDGTVRAWGYNSKGQLGNGTVISSGTPVIVRKTPGGSPLTGVAKIAAAQESSLALLTDGTVVQWGVTGSTYAGPSSYYEIHHSTPQAVLNLANIVAISAHGLQRLAVDASGKVHHWWAAHLPWAPLSFFSQTPQMFPLPQPAVAIAAGGAHAMALLADGTVRTWGANWSGQLGKGSVASSSEFLTSPVTVVAGGAPLSGVTAIGAGLDHSLAVLQDGTVRGWGYNSWGQVGNGSGAFLNAGPFVVPSPVQVANLIGGSRVEGGIFHSVALLTGGTIRAWGNNDYGQLGMGQIGPSSGTPVAVMGLSGVLSVRAGGTFSIALVAP